MKRDYVSPVSAFAISACATLLTYNFALWHFFRGYNEVSNMLVLPVIGALVVGNLVAAGAFWAQHRRSNREGFSRTAAALLVAAFVTACSPLFAPWIGRFANRNLWIKTSLIQAARYGDAPTVIALLEDGADPNERRPALDTTPLHYMARGGNVRAVELLLRKGADPNARQDFSLETPLHWAVDARTNLPTIRVLVTHGASRTITDQDGETPVEYTETIPEPQASEIRNAMRRPNE